MGPGVYKNQDLVILMDQTSNDLRLSKKACQGASESLTLNKNISEICVNIIPEQATSNSAAKKYTEHSPIGQIHSEQ